VVGETVSGGGGYLLAVLRTSEGIQIPAACIPSTREIAVFNTNTDIGATSRYRTADRRCFRSLRESRWCMTCSRQSASLAESWSRRAS